MPDQCGEIKQTIILKEKSTGLSRCAAFVVFATAAEADGAIAKFATPITLPGAFAPLEVRNPTRQSSDSFPWCLLAQSWEQHLQNPLWWGLAKVIEAVEKVPENFNYITFVELLLG
jgi:hypothetical protein